MVIKNLTPHVVRLYYPDGTIRAYQSEGCVRCAETTIQTGDVDGFPIKEKLYGGVAGLPEPREGVVYLVSYRAAQRIYGREDIFVPDEMVKDAAGHIIGCRSLARVNH